MVDAHSHLHHLYYGPGVRPLRAGGPGEGVTCGCGSLACSGEVDEELGGFGASPDWEAGDAAVAAALERAAKRGVTLVVSCACHPGDHAGAARAARLHPGRVVAMFGLHPWWVGRAPRAWAQGLRDQLESNPCAAVGECGLDKVHARRHPLTAGLDAQVRELRTQLALAAEFRRPISLHCVQAHGRLLDELSAFVSSAQGRGWPSAEATVLLHAYAGAPETTLRYERILGPHVYYGAGYETLGRMAPAKAAALLGSVPGDRLVLESDTVDPAAVSDVAYLVCELLASWDTMDPAALIRRSALAGRRFLALLPDRP